ncbi:MerR family transcriptional regulator [Thalassotalea sp. ND16A]|uniref:MerR family transcriptional regulator n=1 Tax=Thalassotalea sp. ND16A TaxID=1535422 RepID=UPI00051A34F7|nr:MerR family transcriptional regulator [Thalassotalea sp. ND16A]KGJ88022.1 putative transcriptional regulator, MerR family [Thalassotalea sp. ND16A]
MFTVTKLAKTCKVSRATILYYERAGLLEPTVRSENGYRWYGESEINRLNDIIRFRSFGIPVAEIETLLDHESEVCQAEILKAQFEKLEYNILALRKQQSAIVALLQQPELVEKNMVTKERWVEIMKATGFSENDMTNWHKNFEKMEPEEHQLFLESLGIAKDEIVKIRGL